MLLYTEYEWESVYGWVCVCVREEERAREREREREMVACVYLFVFHFSFYLANNFSYIELFPFNDFMLKCTRMTPYRRTKTTKMNMYMEHEYIHCGYKFYFSSFQFQFCMEIFFSNTKFSKFKHFLYTFEICNTIIWHVAWALFNLVIVKHFIILSHWIVVIDYAIQLTSLNASCE